MRRELIRDYSQIPISQSNEDRVFRFLQIPISALGMVVLSDIGEKTEMG